MKCKITVFVFLVICFALGLAGAAEKPYFYEIISTSDKTLNFNLYVFHHKYQWIESNDAEASVYAWLRRGGPRDPEVAVICNFTPMVREGYRVGLPASGYWREVLNTDARRYGGTNTGNGGGVESEEVAYHEQPASAVLTIPPLAAIFLRRGG